MDKADMNCSGMIASWNQLQSLRKSFAAEILSMYKNQHGTTPRNIKPQCHRLTRRVTPKILELVKRHGFTLEIPPTWDDLCPRLKKKLKVTNQNQSNLQGILIELLRAVVLWSKAETPNDGSNSSDEDQESQDPPLGFPSHNPADVTLGEELTNQPLKQQEIDKINLTCLFRYKGADISPFALVDKLLAGGDDATELLEMIEYGIAKEQILSKKKRKKAAPAAFGEGHDAGSISRGKKGGSKSGHPVRKKMRKESKPMVYIDDEAQDDQDDDDNEDDEESVEGSENSFIDDGPTDSNSVASETIVADLIGNNKEQDNLKDILQKFGDHPAPHGAGPIVRALDQEVAATKAKQAKLSCRKDREDNIAAYKEPERSQDESEEIGTPKLKEDNARLERLLNDSMDKQRCLTEANEVLTGTITNLKFKNESLAKRLQRYKDKILKSSQEADWEKECKRLQELVDHMQKQFESEKNAQAAEYKGVLDQNQDYKKDIMKLKNELGLAQIRFQRNLKKRDNLLKAQMKSLEICREITDKCQHCQTEIKKYQTNNKKRRVNGNDENDNPNSSSSRAPPAAKKTC